MAALDRTFDPADFPVLLATLKKDLDLPDFIPDVARLEWCRYKVRQDIAPLQAPRDVFAVNPTLQILPLSWRQLADLVAAGSDLKGALPVRSLVHALVWGHPKTGAIHLREAGDIDFLALKMIVEKIDPRVAAGMGHVTVGAIQAALDRAVAQGLILSPVSGIRRMPASSAEFSDDQAPFASAETFTLQWHITQACDLHCKHCYDRRARPPMSLEFAIAVLDDFYSFCRSKHVAGHVTFTGGNPLLYPHFIEVYQAAADYGFDLAILGNPASRERMDRICDVARPAYFQISLEGLPAHNDDIRGKGHFERSLLFLDQLKDLDIFSMVMLTLTRDNIDQVLPLAALLQNRADAFNFNRLSAVGEGAKLAMPAKAQFKAFLGEYVQAADKNPLLGLKDNLINIIRLEKKMPPFGGCTGYGCGAAFNFVALLSDGEVHACRKFPSPIGNVRRARLADIYDSTMAQKYRNGGAECTDCHLAPVCRGCLAVTYSQGLDPFVARDPFCFASAAVCKERGRRSAPDEIV